MYIYTVYIHIDIDAHNHDMCLERHMYLCLYASPYMSLI